MEISFFPMQQSEPIKVEMEQVPRKGDDIVLHGEKYTVETITWQPFDEETPAVISEIR